MERLSWRLGASLGKGAAAFPRSRNPRRPRPRRRPSVGGLLCGAAAAATNAADTLQAGAWEKLNPFFAGEAIFKSLSGWFLICGLAVKAAPWGERENLSVSTGHIATEAWTWEAFLFQAG